MLTGAEPKMPPKNRVIRIDSMFLLVAVPIEKRPNPTIAGNIETRRPHSSDTGAQQRGPKANPNLGPESLIYMRSEGGSTLHHKLTCIARYIER